MTDQHPITPSPELIEYWIELSRPSAVGYADPNKIATLAARWGADQELEACLCEVSFLNSRALADRVRTNRRPKSPSLKERALQAAQRFYANDYVHDEEVKDDFDTICRALEALHD